MKAHNPELIKYLAYCDSAYPVQIATTPMDEARFQYLRAKVNSIVMAYTPSPLKGNLDAFTKALEDFFNANSQPQEAYWAEVWHRSGRKAMGNYSAKVVVRTT